MKRLLKRPQGGWEAFDRRGERCLADIQEKLLPEHASQYVAVNVETGEYTLAETPQEALSQFLARWPDQIAYRRRVDGGPTFKFHGK